MKKIISGAKIALFILFHNKFFLIMRLTLLLTFIFSLNVFASVYSQNTKLDIDVNGQTVREVLKIIENESLFRFFYNDDFTDLNKPVFLSANDKTLEEILASVFSKSDVTYKIMENNFVVITPVEPDQPITVRGLITDAGTGEPLFGVSIVVEGTTTVTLSDINGKYSIEVPDTNAVLLFSFIGYTSQRIETNNRTDISVSLAIDVKSLSEVVVIGYGTRQKKDLTGAVSQINAKDIVNKVSLSPQLAMQGKMAGVFVGNPGSNPYARPTIQIRGVSTIGFNDPLYVVDGIPLTEGGASSTLARTQDQRSPINVFQMINPNDIETISVLKDASATAIYGVRASNGVILITTKRGTEGKAKFEASASYGIQNIPKSYDVASIDEYVALSLEADLNNTAVNMATDPYYSLYDVTSPNYLGGSPNYTDDWRKAALVKNAAIQDYNISVSGGNKTSTYATGIGYSNQENALYYNTFDRYSMFFNSDHKLTKWLKLGESFRFIYSNTENKSGPGLNAVFTVPWQPLYDPAGLNGYALPGRTINGVFRSYGYGLGTQSVFPAIGEYISDRRDLLRDMGVLYAEVSPLKGLRIKGSLSFDYYTNNQELYTEMDRGLYENGRGTRYSTEGNTFRRRTNENINMVKEFLIGYNKTFGKHNIDVILNVMDQKIKWNVGQYGVDLASPITSYEQRRIEEGWDRLNKTVHYERYPSGLQGYMGRFGYNFGSKYYFDATVRRDGSSKFGPDYQWGVFPAFAAAWRISSESFMTNLNWLNDLKIRAGWGEVGNQETRDFAYLSLVNTNPKVAFGTGTTPGNGIIYQATALGDFPIEDMSWETVTTLNFGFDAVLLENKMNLTAEYYNRLTDGVLQTISIPMVIGAITKPVVNLAQVVNKGFEFQASYSDKIGEIGFNVSMNLTTINNNVENLYNGLPSTTGNYRIEEGYSMNFIYGYVTDGIFQTAQEVTDWKAGTTDTGRDAQKSPGDIRFVDIYGAPTVAGTLKSYEPDGKVDAYDQKYLGKTIPGYYYGLNFGVNYNNWDLNLSFRGVGDVQKINTNGKLSMGGFNTNFLAVYRDRWTVDNPSNTIPRAIYADPSGNNRISDRMVEDAGFFRFQSFQVGYNFKGSFLNKLGLDNLRCYFSGSNIFVLSPYTDLDPEDNTTPRTFMFGANISF